MTTLLLARLCTSSGLRIAAVKQLPKNVVFRNYARDARQTIERTTRRPTLRERAMAPPSENGNSDIVICRCHFISHF